MTATPAKSVRPVSPQLEQPPWTDEWHDEFAWKSRLSTSKTFWEQPAGMRFAEPRQEETASPERPVITLLDSRKSSRILRIIDTDRPATIIRGSRIFFSANVPISPEIESRFGKDVTARTDIQTETDQKAESVVKEEVLRILNMYAEDDFETGYVSALEQKFRALIDSYGDKAINAMQGELQANQASTSALAEMVRGFGRIRADSTFEARYAACIRALSHPDLTVRDAAALALCDLEDPRAISSLRAAAAKETNFLVQTSHRKIADWLESLPACQPSSET